MRAIIHEKGQRFGRLTVEREAHRDQGQVHWSCRCDCGARKVVFGTLLRVGSVKSCGCLNRDSSSARYKLLATKHGHARDGRESPEYKTWHGMHTRCRATVESDPKRWFSYGARGIRVCRRWSGRDGFSNFLLDMGPKPPGLTLDRRDNDGHYTPRNCRWATWSVQARNRRASRRAA
jgi:hypothetical protein